MVRPQRPLSNFEDAFCKRERLGEAAGPDQAQYLRFEALGFNNWRRGREGWGSERNGKEEDGKCECLGREADGAIPFGETGESGAREIK